MFSLASGWASSEREAAVDFGGSPKRRPGRTSAARGPPSSPMAVVLSGDPSSSSFHPLRLLDLCDCRGPPSCPWPRTFRPPESSLLERWWPKRPTAEGEESQGLGQRISPSGLPFGRATKVHRRLPFRARPTGGRRGGSAARGPVGGR